MDKKPVSKAFLKADIQRLHSDAAGLYLLIVNAQLPSNHDLSALKENIHRAVEFFREAEFSLCAVDKKFGEAFEPIGPDNKN